MQKEEIVNRLTPVFRKVFSDNSLVVTDELSALDVENWDSLSHMLLISEVETEFAIKFKLKDLNKMANVGDMIEIIRSKFQ
ncbi:MAG TPA: acyl carrier protein [Ferruginibacter sp.]|jgi:acyl carrier protein|nr:acyl carrier protein [Ferruginibacter sp.]MBN8698496.1 acyl carrier protein [Chitinophagales bacterium]HMW25806.1 acyl carrier protein [Ferruginibacter sp.]HMX35659.1 acyl carrier protein [Ferruginibacter sp.]HMX78929.1 acyl carrier protein [Ferruginibacter sp.]